MAAWQALSTANESSGQYYDSIDFIASDLSYPFDGNVFLQSGSPYHINDNGNAIWFGRLNDVLLNRATIPTGKIGNIITDGASNGPGINLNDTPYLDTQNVFTSGQFAPTIAVPDPTASNVFLAKWIGWSWYNQLGISIPYVALGSNTPPYLWGLNYPGSNFVQEVGTKLYEKCWNTWTGGTLFSGLQAVNSPTVRLSLDGTTSTQIDVSLPGSPNAIGADFGVHNLNVTGTCTGCGGGTSAFSALTGGTNTTAAMLVGSGASLGPTGTGTIQATNIASTVAVSSPITVTGSGTVGSPYTIACPTCGTSSGGTNVSQNSGSAETNLPITGFMPQFCSDTSGSGTAQSCTVANTFVPQTGNTIVYSTTTTNSGTGLTINVNSLGAKSVAIPGSSGWTTTLTANIIPANKPLILSYDGTNWNVQQTGTVSGGGGGVDPAVVQSTTASSYAVSSSTATVTLSSAPTVGNALVFLVGGWAGTYTPPAGLTNLGGLSSSNQQIQIYIRRVQSGDGTTWAFTTSADAIGVYVAEISNAGYIQATVENIGNPPTSGATSTAPLTQILKPNAMVFGLFEADSATSSVAGTGYTQDAYIATHGTSHPVVIERGSTLFTNSTFVLPSTTWTGVTTSMPVFAASVIVNSD